jgi:hypothetical protein
MCTGAEVGLILAATGGGASAINNARTLKKQDTTTALGIQKNAKSQREADARVNKQISDIGTNTGETERAASLNDFQNALRAGQSDTEGALSPVVGANARFAEGVSGAKADLQTEGGEQAQRLSVIDGILRQRIGEGQDINRTAGDVNAIKNNITGQEFLTRLKAASHTNNPLVDVLAGVAKGAGSSLALGGILPGGGAAGGAPAIIGEAGVPIGGAGAVGPFSGVDLTKLFG